MGYETLLCEVRDQVATVTLNRPKVLNALNAQTFDDLEAVFQALADDTAVRVILLTGAGEKAFAAGADINEIAATDTATGLEKARRGQAVFRLIETCCKPVIALINGFALGGGLELALACRYRVAADDEKLSLGLPEVQLGIHPGFGGTVRTVRLVGVRPAMEMMLTGKPIRGSRASRIGLIDKLVPLQDLRKAAKEIALQPPPRRQAPFGERVLSWPIVRGFVKKALVSQVAARARRDHYPAPYAMIDLWARGGDSYEAEARSIAELFLTETSRSLVRVFLLQDRLKALGGKGGPDIKHVHVVGAGVMGGDIAAWSAMRGFTVTLQDRGLEYIEPALKRAHELFDKRLRDPAKNAAARERLRADVQAEGVSAADIVIEAIFESLDAKRELYARLEPRMKADALLATNTSSLMLEPLTENLVRPQRLVGLHFFNPVAQMPLIEIVQSARTDPAVLQGAIAFARKLDKLPVPCRSAPGFVVNRVLMPYLYEAMFAAQEGVPLAVIDQAAVDFGMPMGPIELADVVGLDVATHVGEIIAAELGRAAPDLTRLKELVAAKKLGRKSGEGFYVWQHGKPHKSPVNASAAPADLIDRLILILVNECVACLRERVVEEPDLVDAAVIFGTGFAPFRGGPLGYARTRGVDAVVARLGELEARHGARFTADPGWPLLGSAGGKP